MIDTKVFSKLPSIKMDQSYLLWMANCLEIFRDHEKEKLSDPDGFDMAWFDSVQKIIDVLKTNDGGITENELAGYQDAIEFLNILNEGE